MGKKENVVKIDYCTPENMKKMEEEEKRAEENRKRILAERVEQKKREEEEERKRKAEDAKILFRKPKPKEPLYKPSRLIDIDTDLAIANMEEDLKSVRETVEYVATKLGEIEEYIYRKDNPSRGLVSKETKKKLQSVKIKRLKRKVKKQ
jgi:hypothetical protein